MLPVTIQVRHWRTSSTTNAGRTSPDEGRERRAPAAAGRRDAEPPEQFDDLFFSGPLRERFQGQVPEDKNACWLIEESKRKVFRNRNR
jgi:hypothetical protein